MVWELGGNGFKAAIVTVQEAEETMVIINLKRNCFQRKKKHEKE